MNKEVILEKLRPYILEISNPARYFASEYIVGKKDCLESDVKCAMCFPDLYEIGMSNNSIKIIYNQINNIEGAYCDRVFAVAPDFEKLLRSLEIPLFTIENLLPLNILDFLGVSIGYELSATNILQILDLGGIPIHAKDRGETDPVVIAGGPASTNPLPFAPFFDFVFIGESENGMDDVIEIMKKSKTRSERMEKLKKLPFLWYPEKDLAIRAVDTTFGQKTENKYLYNHYPIASFDVVHDHGTAEIMRGCPNGCRFCHAGQYYKPFRQRSISQIEEIVKQNVDCFGYREITLSSLSSGDYPDLDILINKLNDTYKNRGISFSLPSLKVSTFSLDILEQISEVRRSGLTFAIETPLLEDQRSMNKEVYADKIIAIIQEAKKRGWKLAKFYFMIGLPFVDMDSQEKNITDFLLKIRMATKINMNINIGTFIPKAHTPFQWVRQLSVEESALYLKNIKKSLIAAIPGIKVSYHEPFISFLEGVISRGGKDCAKLIETAYEKGARMDAWDEYLDIDIWKESMEELGYNYRDSFNLEEELPWNSVSMNVSKAYLKNEYLKAEERKLTAICSDFCNHKCGVCNKNCSVHRAENTSENITTENCNVENNGFSEKITVSDLNKVFDLKAQKTEKIASSSKQKDLNTLEHAEDTLKNEVERVNAAAFEHAEDTLKNEVERVNATVFEQQKEASQNKAEIVKTEKQPDFLNQCVKNNEKNTNSEGNTVYQQVIIVYSKSGMAIYNSHIAVMRQFEMAFMRSGLKVHFTEGFNPKPRLEFLNPLSMGVYGKEELLLCELPAESINAGLIEKINSFIATGYNVLAYQAVPIVKSGRKISLTSILDYSVFRFENITDKLISESLEEHIGKNSDFEITKKTIGTSDIFEIKVHGDKNIFKNLFPAELNKFYIAGHSKITRTEIKLNRNF